MAGCTPALFQDVLALEKLLHRMVYDDALMRRGWRLEYLSLMRGVPHFRLYRSTRRGLALHGIVDVRKVWQQASIERDLALYLAGLGFTPRNTRLIAAGAKTPPDAPKVNLPYLFIPRWSEHYYPAVLDYTR